MTHRRRFVGILLAALAPAHAAQYCGTAQWEPLIDEAAARFTLPTSWLHAVMRAESAGCVRMDGKPTTSSAGAMGLMQLMPRTWAMLRDRLDLGDDPHDPRDNILAGAAYLAELYERYGRDGAFAAYHAGPRRYDEHLDGTRSLPAATRAYTARVQLALGSVREDSPEGTPPDAPPTREISCAGDAILARPRPMPNLPSFDRCLHRSRVMRPARIVRLRRHAMCSLRSKAHDID